jgi:hypothetical protein
MILIVFCIFISPILYFDKQIKREFFVNKLFEFIQEKPTVRARLLGRYGKRPHCGGATAVDVSGCTGIGDTGTI